MDVTWMRHQHSGRTRPQAPHAFANIDLDAGFTTLEPIGNCGNFSTDRLVEAPDDDADRCKRCLRTLSNNQERAQ